jgi:hypothetical protein
MERHGRREERVGVHLPLRVLGYDPEGASWQEETETGDVSEGGLAFHLKRPIFRGQCLRVALPMPRGLRRFDLDEPLYRAYVIVRSAVLEGGSCRVGAMVFGQEPPRGYAENPAARFRLPTDPHDEDLAQPPPPRREAAQEAEPPDPLGRRAHERVDNFVEFVIEQVDEWGAVLREERTVAENISRGGARILTAGPYVKGDVVELHEVKGPFASRAEICDVRSGADGIRRLHVRFLDGSPDHLVRRA